MSSESPACPELVRWELRGRIAVLTLDAPPANTYSHEMMRQLDALILRARFDDEIDLIVLRGAGERFFCAGADIKLLQEASPTWKYAFCLHANETLSRLEHTPKLVVAAINGHCVGGGLEVALACDFRVARRGSYRLGLPEVALGVLPGTGGTQRLSRLLGKSRALEMMVRGETFEPEEALGRGLLSELLPGETEEAFLASVLEWAAPFLRPRAAVLALGGVKRACQTGAELPLEQGLALERELQARLFASADAREGLAAYTEKRPPEFEGR